MRNLKRALSLTLASVMLLGMMVVGSSAAKGYDDVAETDNVEAIEVVQAVEVMVGDENGNFRPGDSVSRAEMAVVMGKLLNLDYNYYSATCPFTDVSGVYDWARGWVGAAAANGIVSGRGEGIYDPGATVTAVEAASMMMRALGYFKYSNDYADGFEVSTVRLGTTIGIFDNVGSSATAPMTRNQVAQMVLNALQSGVVEPDGNTINLTTPDGSVLTGRVNYVYVTSNKDFAYSIGKVGATSIGSQNTGAIVELGERLYNGDLKLYDYQMDAFGRPARQWEHKGHEIGTYVKKELLKKEWTVEVTGKDLYDLLTKNTVEDYDFEITIDGETEQSVLTDNYYFTQGNLVRTNTKGVGGTGKGVLTQVFVDPNEGSNGKVYIAIINTYLAIADDDYNEKREEASFTIYRINSVNSNKALLKDKGSTAGRDVKNEDIKVEDVKKDDIVLVRVAENEIKEIIAPEILSDQTINAFKLNSWVKTDGVQYDEANTAQYDASVLNQYSNHNMKEVTFNIILDMYGYMIGIEQNEDPDQYVFITGNDGGSSDLRDKESEVAGIFLDGTMKVIKVDTKKSDPISGGAIVNKWFTYTKNDDDVYTLKAISTSFAGDQGQWAQNVNDAAKVSSYANANSADSYTIDKAHVALLASSDGKQTDRRVYGNDDTVYLNVSTSVIGTKSAYPVNKGGRATTITGNGYGDIASATSTNEDNSNYYTTSGNSLAVIIDDVDSVTTGVKNANILVSDVKASQYDNGAGGKYADGAVAVPKSEIYTLYDTDGYVIAAVVIGEDQGTTTQYAYVHTSNVEFEEYGHKTGSSSKAVEGKWSWERKVIINGEIVTLTEVEDSDWAYIEPENMLQGEWYKVSYNADGNVRKVEKATEFPANRYATDVDLVETYHDLNQDLVILEVNYTGTDDIHAEANNNSAKAVPIADRGPLSGGLRFENGTLYTDYVNRKGFSVAADVKVVYANAELKKGYDTTSCGDFSKVDWFDETYGNYTGYAGVERVLKLIDSRDSGKFYGVLNAVLENGVATSIIINDTYGEYVDRGGAVKPGTGEFDTVTRSGNNFTVWYYDDNFGTDKAMDSDDIRDYAANQISAYFNNAPVANVAWSRVSNTGTVYLDDGTLKGEAVSVVATKRVSKVFVDNVEVGYIENDDATDMTAAKWDLGGKAAALSGNYLVDEYANTTAATLTTVTADDEAKDVYLFSAVSITLNDTITGAYTEFDRTAGSIATGTATLVAKKTPLTLTLTGKNDSKTYQMSGSVRGAFGPAQALTATTDKLIASYVVDKAETVSASNSVRIYVKTATGTTPVDLDAAATTIGAIAGDASVLERDYGNWFVKLKANGDPDDTAVVEIDDAGATDLTVTPGATYAFGYYKATISGTSTAADKAYYVKDNFTLAGLVGSTYAKGTHGTAAQLSDGTTYVDADDTLNITDDETYAMKYYKVTVTPTVTVPGGSTCTDIALLGNATTTTQYAKATDTVAVSITPSSAITTALTLTYTPSNATTAATVTKDLAVGATGAQSQDVVLATITDDVVIAVTAVNQ